MARSTTTFRGVPATEIPVQAGAASSEPQTPAKRLQSHEGYAAAKDKWNRLDSERAAVQAKLDQARAALHDADKIASKILAGEELTVEDAVNTEAETAKLRGYELALARQRGLIEQQLRIVSAEICDDEAGTHRQRAEELVASAERFFGTVDAMEQHVKELQNAGVIVDNRFPIFDGMRLRQMVLGSQPIVAKFKTFLQ